MFGVGLPELAVIAFVAVLVFGPDKLPDFARQAGRMARKVREFANEARDELREELGPEFADLDFKDLDPRTIVRKHIIEAMNEDPDEPVTAAVDPPRRRRAPALGRGRDVAVPRGLSPGSAPRRSRRGQQQGAPLAHGDLDEVGPTRVSTRLAGGAVDAVDHAPLARVRQPPQGRAEPEPGDR